MREVKGFGFRLTGMILGIVGITISVTAIVFAVIGWRKAYICRHCKLEDEYK